MKGAFFEGESRTCCRMRSMTFQSLQTSLTACHLETSVSSS
jgi:hypothetical protein